MYLYLFNFTAVLVSFFFNGGGFFFPLFPKIKNATDTFNFKFFFLSISLSDNYFDKFNTKLQENPIYNLSTFYCTLFCITK